MLNVFKRTDFLSLLALVLMAFLCKMYYLLHPPQFLGAEWARGFVFSWHGLLHYARTHPGLYVFFSTCIQVVFAIYFNFIINRERFFQRKSWFPALSFLIFSSFLPQHFIFSYPFIASVLSFAAWGLLLKVNNSTRPRLDVFNVGMLLGIAVFFYFPAVLFFPCFLLTLWLLRPFILQEAVACLLGFLTPFYFLAAVLLLTNRFSGAMQQMYLHFDIPRVIAPYRQWVLFASVTLLLGAYAFFVHRKFAYRNSIFTRKKWSMLLMFVFVSLLAGALSPALPAPGMVLLMAPFSILLSQGLQHDKENLNIFTFLFFIAALLISQWLF